MRDCRFSENGTCVCVPDEPHPCPFEKDQRFRCMEYEGVNV